MIIKEKDLTQDLIFTDLFNIYQDLTIYKKNKQSIEDFHITHLTISGTQVHLIMVQQKIILQYMKVVQDYILYLNPVY